MIRFAVNLFPKLSVSNFKNKKEYNPLKINVFYSLLTFETRILGVCILMIFLTPFQYGLANVIGRVANRCQ